MAVNINGGALEFSASINAAQFNAAISQIEKQLLSLTNTAEREANSIEKVARNAATAIAAYASFTTASNFVQDIVRVRGEFQQLEVAFTTMLQSREKADKLMQEITQFAATTPFELKDVAGATKQLLAFGISADDIIPTLRSLGDISAGIGAPVGEIAYLFGSIKTQGKAMTLDIRQFAQRGIPIYEELAKVLKVDQTELNGFIEAGKVGFPEIQQVFKNLTAEGSKFGGLMEAQSKTLTGQISNLKDAWNQMLNDIGKGQEGLFADAISSATYLVKNFESVLDILKVLIITYGSYKAAVIATSVVQGIAASAANGYTIAQTLQYRAMLISEKAMKLLNRTMLANPFVAVATAIGAIVAALLIFNRRASEAKDKATLLADANEKVGDRMAETEAKIRPYVEQLKNANLSEQQRLDIYNKLKEIDPKIIAGLDAKTLSYQTLTANVNAYLGALRKQLGIEANREALTGSIKQEQNLDARIKQLNKAIDADQKLIAQQKNIDSQTAREARSRIFQSREELKNLTADLERQKKTTQEFGEESVKSEGETEEAKKRTIEVIDEEIKQQKKLQEENSTNAKQFNEYQKKINELEEEKKRIVGASKSDAKAAQVEENKTNSLLEKRKDLLQAIEDIKRGAKQSGLIKEQTELDKINEKYDALLQNIVDYNKKVDAFNKKNPKANVQKVGQADIVELNSARNRELSNTTLKEQAEEYKKYLQNQRDVFIQFEDAKKDVGIAKANEMFREQTGNYEDFLQLLNAEAAKLLPKITLGIANIGEVQKFRAIIDQIQQYNKDKTAKALEDEKKNFMELLAATVTYNDDKAAINKKYDDLEKTLNKNKNVSDFEERKKLLQQGRQEELDALNNNIIRQSALYKKLNQDIIGFTRQRLKDEIKLLKESLSKDKTLTPEVKAAIQSTINQYQGLLDETNQTAKDFANIASKLGSVSSAFSTLANSLEGLNSEVADSLQNFSDMASIGADAASAIASFAMGDVVAGITSAANAIGKIIDGFAKAKKSKQDAQQKIANFQQQIYQGEVAYGELVRQRIREEVKAGKLKLQGLQDEKKLLQEQKDIVLKNYNEIFAKLQNESFISGKTKKKKSGNPLTGILGFLSGSRTTVQDELSSLAGKSFADIEKLFLSGQLTDNAKKLFEQLKAIKDEGVDIDKMIADNALALQEAFTGTNTDSISDSIIEGFKNGLNSASDFASTFEDLMRNALIQSLKFKYLEGPLKDFFTEFAAASESDGQLTSSEIAQLKSTFNQIITNADQQFQQLQQIAGLNFNSTGSGINSLQGAIKGMTEQQAELLAGQFGGLRITALDALQVSRQQLATMNNIQSNTAATASRLAQLLAKFDGYETGLQKLNVKI